MTTSDGVNAAGRRVPPACAQRSPRRFSCGFRFPRRSINSLFATVVGRFWAERGYTVVIQGTRGRYQIRRPSHAAGRRAARRPGDARLVEPAAMVRWPARDVGRLRVRLHAVGDCRSPAVTAKRAIGVDGSDFQHRLPWDVPPGRSVLARKRTVHGRCAAVAPMMCCRPSARSVADSTGFLSSRPTIGPSATSAFSTTG